MRGTSKSLQEGVEGGLEGVLEGVLGEGLGWGIVVKIRSGAVYNANSKFEGLTLLKYIVCPCLPAALTSVSGSCITHATLQCEDVKMQRE